MEDEGRGTGRGASGRNAIGEKGERWEEASALGARAIS